MGNIGFNPFCSVNLADSLLKKGGKENRRLALDELSNALSLNDKQKPFYSAHMKLFEFHIDSGDQIFKKYIQALGKIIILPSVDN